MSVAFAAPIKECDQIPNELDRIKSAFQQLTQTLRAMEQERDSLQAEVNRLRIDRDQYRKAFAIYAMAEVTPEELERRASEPSKPYAEVLARLEQLKNSST